MHRLASLILLFAFAGAGPANAIEVEKIFMPGDLIEGHAEHESECTKCHSRGRDITQRRLCLDCHDKIDADINGKKGYHGKYKNASTLDCKACHSDHKGRNAKVVWLDQDSFDHQFTDYLLQGRHRQTECRACHLEKKKFREAPHGCYDCHREDDAHEGSLGKKCDTCHNPDGWGKGDFDHDKTDFPLRFSHRKVACDACHVDNRYKDTPAQCVSCHAIRDIHENRFGNKCQTCHQESKWSDSKFDHNRDTDYRIAGKHREVACNDCHGDNYLARKEKDVVRACFSCHREDDVHKESNGRECKNCHTERGWGETAFDHDTGTDFPLRGGHADLACATCHIPGAESREIDTSCYSCHKINDPHRNELGKECGQCHNEVGWQNRVRFDHDLASFPLIGQHAAVSCDACHVSSVFSDSPTGCYDCHLEDDVHKESMGEDCARCHNPNAWLIWTFDHDRTSFKLRDAHARVHCHTCHFKPLDEADMENWRCVDCHHRDDVHEGNFGTQCNQCHNEKSFDELDINSLRDLGRAKSDTGEKKP